MRFRVIPRENSFFDLFEEMARIVQRGADALLDLLNNYDHVDERSTHIFDIEHEGDDTTHQIIRKLNTTFITPFDREDIHRLANNLDHVLDHCEAAAEYLQLHRIEQPIKKMIQLGETLAAGARITAEAMPNLRKMKDLDNYWVEIDKLEDEGDRLYRRTIAELFSGDFKTMDVLKFKDVVEEIEGAIDRLEDIADVVEGIVLKQS